MSYLFLVISTAFDVSPSPVTPTDEECEKLVALGKTQSILPAIYVGLKKIDILADVLKTVDQEQSKEHRLFVLHSFDQLLTSLGL